jgi:diguanylate cyclase (GGDEF)-like protein/PAS domain S-box-containing protein
MGIGPVISDTLNVILNHSPVVFYISELRENNHAPEWISPNIKALLGYQQEEALQPGWWKENLHPDDHENIESRLVKISTSDKKLVLEYRFRHKDGEYRWIRDTVHTGTDYGSSVAVYGIWEDITSYRQNLDKFINLQRAYGMLTKTNQLLIQRKDLQQLYKDICDIAVNDGGFRMAWIGYLKKETGEIIPVARAGVDLGYIDQIGATMDSNDPRSLGPATRAIRENRVIVIKDTMTDETVAVWREKVLKRGFRSVIGLPINTGNGARGVLMLYADEPDYFNEEEIELLRELANDLSVGIKKINDELNLHEARQQLKRIAYYDSLTDLPNMNYLFEQMDLFFSGNHGGRSALIILQIDGFNEINHVLGYTRGDEMLKLLSERVCVSVRSEHVIARVAGTKFAIFVPDVSSVDTIQSLVRQLNQRIREPMLVQSIPIELRSHAGIAFSPEHGKTAKQLFRAADMARVMSGKEREPYLVYETDMETDPQKLGLVAELRRAIKNHELVLYYQPKIDLSSRRVTGAEALVRWLHPQRGMIPPMDFVTVAENTGIITNITYYVLANAMRDFLDLRKDGMDTSVAVNISGRDLENDDFTHNIEKFLGQYSADPESLILELTETAMMSDMQQCDEILQQIQKFGVKIAVDDFGTGYSSLSYLAHLPLDSLKIDRTFVMDMSTREKCHSIVCSTIDMARNLSLNVTAEGIEDTAMIAELAGLGCREGQGFGIAKPMPVSELRKWVEKTDFKPN